MAGCIVEVRYSDGSVVKHGTQVRTPDNGRRPGWIGLVGCFTGSGRARVLRADGLHFDFRPEVLEVLNQPEHRS
jgi:hypothetical protein